MHYMDAIAMGFGYTVMFIGGFLISVIALGLLAELATKRIIALFRKST